LTIARAQAADSPRQHTRASKRQYASRKNALLVSRKFAHMHPLRLPLAIVLAVTTHVSAQISYPVTRKVEQVDSYHGTSVADPYRWLEDDNSAETQAWVAAQNAVTAKVLASLPRRNAIKARYTELYNFEKYGIPFKEGGRYFWTRNDGLQQHAVLYTAASLTAVPRVLLDPNGFSRDGTVSLTGTAVSRDGKYLAYGTSSGGSDWNEWKVRDVATGKDLPETLKWVKFSGAEWTPDGKGFFYSRYDAPKEGEKLTGANYFQKLYYHRIGQPQEQDELVYHRPDQKEWGFFASASEDGKHLFIGVWKGAESKNGLLVMPLGKGGAYQPGTPRELTLTFDAEYSVLGSHGNSVWIKTNKDAPKGRIVALDLGKPSSAWRTVVPEAAETLSAASLVGGRIFANYLKDAFTEVRLFDPTGKPQGALTLPGVGTATGFGGRMASRETFFSYTSLIDPPSIYRYDIRTATATLFRRPKVAFDSAQYETKQVFVTSRDGTRFPLFLAHRKGIARDGENASLLYAYGGFEVSSNPTFRVTAAAWMDMGGVYALACIRGGGEYGRAWHEAAKGANRQRAFDDFIAAAEWLSANGYSKASRIGINGGSNGGLLVGAVLNQRPELFGAAVPEVGVMDMLRFHKFTIGWAWVPEYGSSDKPDEFKTLFAYSPLHNIRDKVAYPPVMVMTADHDDRVVPAHSFKYAATLQAADTGAAPKIIRIETRAGHGAGTPTSKIIEERSDVLAFLAHALNIGKKDS
jgi:prolyl oligopeptidase